jgi:hypothetical protein
VSHEQTLAAGAETEPRQASVAVEPKKPKLDSSEISNTVNSAPAQLKLRNELEVAKSRLITLQALKDCGLATAENVRHLEDSKISVHESEQKLCRMVKDAERQKRRRSDLKSILTDMAPDNAKIRKFVRAKKGRPALEEDQSDLHSTIIQLVTRGAGADKRRRTEILNACLTLDDLVGELRKMNFTLSRSALYLRLIPRRIDSQEGKKHVQTVPVKLRRPENSERKAHENATFAFCTKEYLKCVASIFGPQTVFVLSIDDKAKVPIGLAAASKQAPLLMCFEYEVRLPDHDFVIAASHKLTPPVYAACVIKAPSRHAELAISYSGPMYIAIRSAKHDSSTAFTHGRDVDHLLQLDSFKEVATHDGCVKPIFLCFVDGGPDENPRFPKTLVVAVDRFKKHNLDAYIAMTHAPGMSAYNYVERRMAPLSKELAGVILPHDAYGSHLNASGRTIDAELKQKNFQKAGEVLGEIWSNLTLDGYPVTAEYVQTATLSAENDVDEAWNARHCRISQYTLQIVKCSNQSCCGDFRTSWMKVFPDRFLPAPYPLRLTTKGPLVPDPSDVQLSDNFMTLWQRLGTTLTPAAAAVYEPQVPYDLFCPTITKELDKRVCRSCKLYLPSKASVTRHRQHGGCSGVLKSAADTEQEEIVAEDGIDGLDSTPTAMQDQEPQPLPDSGRNSQQNAVFRNIFDTFNIPWEDMS